MLFVVIGSRSGISREEIMAIFPRHKAFLDEFIARGEVVGVGPFTDAGGGNMALFRTRARGGRSIRQGRSVSPGRRGEGVSDQGVGRPHAFLAALREYSPALLKRPQ